MGLDIINRLKKEKGLTNAQLAEKSGVTLSTLDKITAGINKNPKLETLQAICRALGCRLGDFDEAGKEESSSAGGVVLSGLSREAEEFAGRYSALDEHGRRALEAILREEESRMAKTVGNVIPMPRPAMKTIPLLGGSFAAGKGEPDFGNMWTDYEVEADSKAEFAIKINGDSMEPYLPDGSIAFGRKDTPADGDVAALLLDGEFLVKQVCQDILGNIYLFSLNRKRADADVTIWHDSERSLYCFGTIIMKKRIPLP